MSDIVDIAQEQEAAFIAERLRAQAEAASLDAPGAAVCADCAGEIPAPRRRALPSAIRCIDCQAWVERVGRV